MALWFKKSGSIYYTGDIDPRNAGEIIANRCAAGWVLDSAAGCRDSEIIQAIFDAFCGGKLSPDLIDNILYSPF